MSGPRDGQRPLRLVPRERKESSEARLAAVIAGAVRASGHEEAADELAASYLEQVSSGPHPSGFDPLTADHGQASPEPPLFEQVLGAVPRLEPGALPAQSGGPDLTTALASPQAEYRESRAGAQRVARDARRARRRGHDRERLEKLRTALFAQHGQAPDIPDIPALRPEVRGLNLSVMRDGSGRRAREVVAKLPMGQQMAIYRLAYAAVAKVRAGVPSSMCRRDLEGVELPRSADELVAALNVIVTEVAPTEWFRRIACAAWAMWSHRGRALSKQARMASRGGIYQVEGFCQGALSWLVPRADGTSWSRSVLWGPGGPFALLGASARRLGSKVPGEAGVGLWVRWQPPAACARFKGPARVNARTGETERFALAQARFDASMSGRSAASLARRARGGLRELARTLTRVLTPWVKLAPRKRRVAKRPESAEVAPQSPDVLGVEREARAPP